QRESAARSTDDRPFDAAPGKDARQLEWARGAHPRPGALRSQASLRRGGSLPVTDRSALWSLAAVAAALLACKATPKPAGGTALPSGAVPVASIPLVVLPPPLPPLPNGAIPSSFADLAARADPGVVFVKTLQARGAPGRQRVVGEGLGSAFVFDPNGLILTNNHVIENASEIRVIFGHKPEVSATVVGRDPPTDVAVLRVEEQGLPYVPLGDSDALRVGDWVVAIGNPFGLSHTVSAGIVSAKGRTNQDVKGLDEAGYYNFLQTDASINPGNSGGPLLDVQGR